MAEVTLASFQRRSGKPFATRYRLAVVLALSNGKNEGRNNQEADSKVATILRKQREITTPKKQSKGMSVTG